MNVFRFSSILVTILLLGGITSHSYAQNNTPETEKQQSPTEYPQWLIDFSNLPKESREQYVSLLNQAKLAFQHNQWINCITLLAECEVIMRGNPNVWNLRVSCLLEQKYYKEAEIELQRVLQLTPHDPVALLNQASVHMVFGRYTESLELTSRLRDDIYLKGTDQNILYVLDYRMLICYLMLGQQDKAEAIAKTVSPVSDTPLYYYAQAAFALKQNDRTTAVRHLGVASRIFANNNACIPFNRVLELSGLGKERD